MKKTVQKRNNATKVPQAKAAALIAAPPPPQAAPDSVQLTQEQAAKLATYREAITRAEREIIVAAHAYRESQTKLSQATEMAALAGQQIQAVINEVMSAASLDQTKNYRYDPATLTLARAD